MASTVLSAMLLSLVWAVVIGIVDLRSRRIPNRLVFGAAALALAHLVVVGISPLGASGGAVALGVLLALLFTLPGYLTRRLGAGDVKLLVAIALLGGTSAVLASFILGSFGTVAGYLVWRHFGPAWGWGLPVAGKCLPLGAGFAGGFIMMLAASFTASLDHGTGSGMFSWP